MAVEQWTLGGLSFHDPSNGLKIRAASVSPARRRAAWLENPDADGAVLGQVPRAALREMVFRLQYSEQASMDTALGKLATVIDKVEACKLDPAGQALVWTPHDSTKSGTFRALLGEIIELPIELGGDGYGWFRGAPVFVVSLTCLPFWEGTTLAVPVDEAWTTPVGSLLLEDVAGDAPALGELVVTNAEATDHVRWLMWGSGPYPGGLVDSDALVTTGFSGTGTTRTGAYDVGGGNTVIRGTMIGSPTAVCGTGELTHRGTFKVLGRVFATEDGAQVRLVWQDKDGPFTANSWAAPTVTDDWAKVDLGTIHLADSDLGDQVWSGRIDAFNASGGTLDVDFLVLVPIVDGHGVARAGVSSTAGAVVAYDDFTGTTAGGALGTRTPAIGAAWATSGAATDFLFSDSVVLGEALLRGASGTRFAVFGSAMTDMKVTTRFLLTGFSWSPAGVIARWVDANNYLRFTFNNQTGEFLVVKTVASTPVTLIQVTDVTAPDVSSGAVTLRLTVRAHGQVVAELLNSAGIVTNEYHAIDVDLATGGALDDGKPGLIHIGNGSSTENFDDITVTTPAPEPIVIYAGQDFRVTHNEAIRGDVDGGRYGVPPSYQPAGHFYVQPAGAANRDTSVVVLGSPTDLDTSAWSTIDHSLEAEVVWTPRGNVVPR